MSLSIMLLDDNPNHYEILEVSPDATQQEIRQAYLRLKLAYSKDSIALYTLVDRDQTEAILGKIEQAYQILSNEEKRREYDRNHALLDTGPAGLSVEPAPELEPMGAKVVSIDRVPPMDRNAGTEDLLVAPSTDFGAAAGNRGTETLGSSGTKMVTKMVTDPQPFTTVSTTLGVSEASLHQTRRFSGTSSLGIASPSASRLEGSSEGSPQDHLLQDEIQHQTEWRGEFLKKIRESRRVSVEELCEFTKISKAYIIAIETENYPKLPAATYVRGFVTQIAKRLRLPHENVANAYVSRYRKACPEKS